MNGVIDTGASINLMDINTYKQLFTKEEREKHAIANKETQVTTVDGTTINTIRIYIDNGNIRLPVHIRTTGNNKKVKSSD